MMKGKLREEIQNSKIIYKIVFGLRGYRFGFSKKLPKASLVSERANASWLQDGYAAGQGRAHQVLTVPQGRCSYEAHHQQQSEGRSENFWKKQPCRYQGQWRKKGRRCFRCQSWDSSAAFDNKWNSFFPQVGSVVPMMATGEWSLPALIYPWAFNYISCLLSTWKR